jgi:hypothetical protein
MTIVYRLAGNFYDKQHNKRFQDDLGHSGGHRARRGRSHRLVRLEVLPEEEAQRQRERQERYGIYSTHRFPEWKMPQNIPFKEIFHNERFVYMGIDRYFAGSA